MLERKSKRSSLRVPVHLALRCDLNDGSTVEADVVNLSTEGILIQSGEPIQLGENLELEFLSPAALNSLRLAGEVAWSRPYHEESGDPEKLRHMAGIRFMNHDELSRSLIREYTIEKLNNDDLRLSGGILLVLEDLRNLPSDDRLKAYHVLIGKGSGSVH